MSALPYASALLCASAHSYHTRSLARTVALLPCRFRFASLPCRSRSLLAPTVHVRCSLLPLPPAARKPHHLKIKQTPAAT
ncbi:hypothetical protein [Methanimicrococcus blatticola]|uniref:hypothetical protein n=1 Tax=Methanimicrococcus blatticola TaxID=91560 RepID=UPI00105ED8E0|nr:hypothetical protein [Methanimicrococcus blatticola]MBZ3935303.1 hypothetical protein [Methanimicrococcus blatticola]MCC2508599.1 hypothetical protein [Methanimicrococcus blatticola]